jgi:2'-5' RNA ligase
MSRYFFALWPDPAVRDGFYRAARNAQSACGGRSVPRGNLHQTLVFVGNVAGERCACLEAAGGRIVAAPFALDFGATGYWPHNRIVWAAPSATPPLLIRLAAALERELTDCGIDFDKRPYVPHVTLVRGARAPAALPALRIAWQPREFVLVESGSGAGGAGYRIAGRWPLAG